MYSQLICDKRGEVKWEVSLVGNSDLLTTVYGSYCGIMLPGTFVGLSFMMPWWSSISFASWCCHPIGFHSFPCRSLFTVFISYSDPCFFIEPVVPPVLTLENELILCADKPLLERHRHILWILYISKSGSTEILLEKLLLEITWNPQTRWPWWII